MNIEDESIANLQLNSGMHIDRIVNLSDGRIIVFDTDREHFPMLRVLDIDKKDRGEVYPAVQRNNYRLFPACSDSPYDFLMSDNIYLYGYCTESQEQTIIFDWVETGFSGSMYFGAMDYETYLNERR